MLKSGAKVLIFAHITKSKTAGNVKNNTPAVIILINIQFKIAFPAFKERLRLVNLLVHDDVLANEGHFVAVGFQELLDVGRRLEWTTEFDA